MIGRKDAFLPPLLAALDLEKTYQRSAGPITVLRDCRFALEAREVVAIIGASGSGKSTFLNILGGLDDPTAGEVQFHGARLDFHDVKAMTRWRRDGVGFVFQFHFLLPDFTALENLLIPLRATGGLTPEGRERALRFLDLMQLGDRADHLPGELSGGQQQRVALARAFMNEPQVVLADEPFGNLDQDISAQLSDLLFRVSRDSGTGMVIVTHDPQLATRADRILHLKDGRLESLATGDAARAMAQLHSRTDDNGGERP